MTEKDNQEVEHDVPEVPVAEQKITAPYLKVVTGSGDFMLPYSHHDEKGRPRFQNEEGGSTRALINENGGVLLTFSSSSQDPVSFGGRAFGTEGVSFGTQKAAEARVLSYKKNDDDEWVPNKEIKQGEKVTIAVVGSNDVADKIRQDARTILIANAEKKLAQEAAKQAAPAPAAPKP